MPTLIVVDNKEVGFNWRGKQGSFGLSYYQSKSALGSSLSVAPVTKDYVLNRKPIKIYGIDVTPEGNVWGRPVGVATAKDGALIVSDDGGNLLWRIAHVGTP